MGIKIGCSWYRNEDIVIINLFNICTFIKDLIDCAIHVIAKIENAEPNLAIILGEDGNGAILVIEIPIADARIEASINITNRNPMIRPIIIDISIVISKIDSIMVFLSLTLNRWCEIEII